MTSYLTETMDNFTRDYYFYTSGYIVLDKPLTSDEQDKVRELLDDVKGFNALFADTVNNYAIETGDYSHIPVDASENFWHFRGTTVTPNGILFDYSYPRLSNKDTINVIYLFLRRLRGIGIETDTFSFTDLAINDEGMTVRINYSTEETEED